MKIFLYRIWHCTWGIVQTFLGLFFIHPAQCFMCGKVTHKNLIDSSSTTIPKKGNILGFEIYLEVC